MFIFKLLCEFSLTVSSSARNTRCIYIISYQKSFKKYNNRNKMENIGHLFIIILK